MIRRRRRVREIPFSFDSFLDIVANVVGIIIRLILVVWVGARSYSSLRTVVKASPPAVNGSPVLELGSDPLQAELAQHARELAQAQERLLLPKVPAAGQDDDANVGHTIAQEPRRRDPGQVRQRQV